MGRVVALVFVGELRLERVIDLPVPIVWDALVDPGLLSGWLHPTEQLLVGTTVRTLVAPRGVGGAQLTVDSPVFGELSIALWRRAGGTRGSSTSLVIDLPDRGADARALWELRVTQLESLLRGRPVCWRDWADAHPREAAAADVEAAHRDL